MKDTTKNIENGIIMSPTTSLEEQIRVLWRMTQSGKSLPTEEDILSTAGVMGGCDGRQPSEGRETGGLLGLSGKTA